MQYTGLIFLLFWMHTGVAQSSDASAVKVADATLNQLILQNKASEAARFIAHEFTLTTAAGVIKNKEAIIDEIRSPELALEINTTENVEVKIHGTTAVLTGILHQKGIFKGKTFDTWLLVTDTWIRTVNGWQILAGHATLRPKT
jgi:hypothetical protein